MVTHERAGAISSDPIGVLASGGLDSSILIGHLLREGRRVQPFYIRTGVVWQAEELPALERFLGALSKSDWAKSDPGKGDRANRDLAKGDPAKLVVLDLPLGDLYGGHWSLTGEDTPAADSPDEAVFLPGRNALLIVKAAVWCQLHAIGELALAPLGTSPFDDASAGFLRDFEAAINRGCSRGVRLSLPFGKMNKQQVMALGHGMPLELTFSCIAPVGRLHCGRCNKCAERQAAFREAGIEDTTEYAHV